MGERFQRLLKQLGFKSNVAFAEAIKSSEGKVRDIIKGRVKTLSPEILDFLILKNVNLNWLFTGIGGEGEMFLGGNTEEPAVYDEKYGSFIQGKTVINGKAEAKKAYEAYLARSGKSPVSADSISLEGLDESEKAHVINTVKILQDAKKKKGK